MSVSPRHAIVLWGPAGVGKTETFHAIDRLCAARGQSACFVNLDDGWGPNEVRSSKGAPEARYPDLVGRSVSVLVVELSRAEPDFGGGAEGASRNPEWAGVLRRDGREVWLFRLTAPWQVADARVKGRPGWNAPQALRKRLFDLLESNAWRTNEKAGLKATAVATEARTAEQVARVILDPIVPEIAP